MVLWDSPVPQSPRGQRSLKNGTNMQESGAQLNSPDVRPTSILQRVLAQVMLVLLLTCKSTLLFAHKHKWWLLGCDDAHL